MADGMLSLSWNNHRATFCHILSTLREKERYTDVTVACEGKFYPVHKLVLSTCSEYFEKMFDNTPCKHPVIVLKDVLPDELEALLSYMYDGVVSVAQNDLARLIKAAELLRIKGLAVPDEPPKPEGNRRKTTQTRNPSDDRSSPHPKRRKADDNSTQSQRAAPSACSPPSSPRVSPFQAENDPKSSSRVQQDSHWMEPRDDSKSDQGQEDRLDNHAGSHSQSPKVQVLVDETLVKEEMVEPISANQDDGLDYGSVGNDSRLEGSCSGEADDNASLMIPNKYEQSTTSTQAQPLPEAVVEALAGPSGMQGWLGSCEVPGGFSGMEGYTGDGSQEVHQPQGTAAAQQQQGHQMVELKKNIEWSDERTATGEWQDITSAASTHLCPYCNFVTDNYNKMNRHIKKHTGEKPFTCTYCSYSTTRKALLDEHINTHTGERPFACPYCSYSSSHKSILRSHIRRHTGEKPYACTFCPYRAAQKSTLNSHLVTHKPKDFLT